MIGRLIAWLRGAWRWLAFVGGFVAAGLLYRKGRRDAALERELADGDARAAQLRAVLEEDRAANLRELGRQRAVARRVRELDEATAAELGAAPPADAAAARAEAERRLAEAEAELAHIDDDPTLPGRPPR